MKKICVLLFLLILIPNILAIQIDMKEEYAQGETLIATLSGTFAESISKQDILFYRDHVKIPFVFNFQKIKGDYHLYAQLLGKIPGNYSFRIGEAKYIELGQTIEKEIRSNFTILDTTADFYVEEGYLQVEDDFTLKVLSLSNEDLSIGISTGEILTQEEDEETSGGLFARIFGGTSGTSSPDTLESLIELNAGQEKNLEFELNEFDNLSQAEIILRSDNTEYIIPVYFSEEIETYEEENNKLRFQPSTLEITLSTNSSTQRIVYIENYGEAVIENITVSLSENLENYTNLSVENINDIEDNSSFKITLDIFPIQEEILINGELNMVFNDNSKSIPLILEVIPGYIPDDDKDGNEDDTDDDSSIKTCDELEGEICKKYEVCSEDTINAKNGNCCLAECNQKPASKTGKIIGWVILIILIGIVYWFIKTKYGRASKKVNLLKIAKGKK